MGLSQEK